MPNSSSLRACGRNSKPPIWPRQSKIFSDASAASADCRRPQPVRSRPASAQLQSAVYQQHSRSAHPSDSRLLRASSRSRHLKCLLDHARRRRRKRIIAPARLLAPRRRPPHRWPPAPRRSSPRKNNPAPQNDSCHLPSSSVEITFEHFDQFVNPHRQTCFFLQFTPYSFAQRFSQSPAFLRESTIRPPAAARPAESAARVRPTSPHRPLPPTDAPDIRGLVTFTHSSAQKFDTGVI